MIRTLLATSGIILLALGAWLIVQTAARRFAARHPELGPAREDDGHGCSGCGDVQGCTSPARGGTRRSPAPRGDLQGCREVEQRMDAVAGTRDRRRGCVNERTDCKREQEF
jgi:hypothetical protein